MAETFPLNYIDCKTSNCFIPTARENGTFSHQYRNTFIRDSGTSTASYRSFVTVSTRIMKYVWANQCPFEQIGHSGLKGKLLYGEEDDIPGYAYEISLQKDENVTLKSAFGSQYNHVYYILYGQADGSIEENTFVLGEDDVVALTPDVCARIHVTSDVKLLAFHTLTSDEVKPEKRYLVKKLNEVLNTKREVDWGCGKSRRFLAKADGFNHSLHSTTCLPNASSPLHYRNNHEICYYYKGNGSYDWDDGKTEVTYDFTKGGQQEGDALVLLIERDPHHLVVSDVESCNICTFYPPLIGHESHTLNSSGFSSY